MRLKKNEHVVLELENGWNVDGKKAILTNKRILFTKKDKIVSEINLNHIAEVIPDISFLGVTSMKIRIFGGREVATTFRCGDLKAVLGSSYILPKQKTITQRWVNTINKLLPR